MACISALYHQSGANSQAKGPRDRSPVLVKSTRVGLLHLKASRSVSIKDIQLWCSPPPRLKMLAHDLVISSGQRLHITKCPHQWYSNSCLPIPTSSNVRRRTCDVNWSAVTYLWMPPQDVSRRSCDFIWLGATQPSQGPGCDIWQTWGSVLSPLVLNKGLSIPSLFSWKLASNPFQGFLIFPILTPTPRSTAIGLA